MKLKYLFIHNNNNNNNNNKIIGSYCQCNNYYPFYLFNNPYS
ncbi:MAG: hypothetical protein N7Q72_05615 [Spiroplasma sp. Tabriz.8]|nr:hypothetical protein [Candidatus Regiella insecticola]MCZ8632723.1 hypothetical protein [Spiroplasma sp. Tabriz.8]